MKIPETFFTVNQELVLFLLSCIFGAAYGVLYDIFRTLRIILPHNSMLVAAEDIAFLVIYGITLSLFASAFSLGQVRFYFVIGNILGFLLYIATVGHIVIGVMKKAVSPFIFLRKKAMLKFVGSSKVIVNSIKNFKTLLHWRPVLLYNKMENKNRKT